MTAIVVLWKWATFLKKNRAFSNKVVLWTDSNVVLGYVPNVFANHVQTICEYSKHLNEIMFTRILIWLIRLAEIWNCLPVKGLHASKGLSWDQAAAYIPDKCWRPLLKIQLLRSYPYIPSKCKCWRIYWRIVFCIFIIKISKWTALVRVVNYQAGSKS